MAKNTKRTGAHADDLPRDLSEPSRRAFALAGYERLEQFAEVSARETLQLHGVGPKALAMIARDLALRGMSFADRADDLPVDLSAAARRALLAAGYERLEQFAGVGADQVARLQGIEPKTLKQIARDLALRGLAFAGGAK